MLHVLQMDNSIVNEFDSAMGRAAPIVVLKTHGDDHKPLSILFVELKT